MNEAARIALRDARNQLNEWLEIERDRYADEKYTVDLRMEGLVALNEDPNLDDQHYWMQFLYRYLQQAKLQGMNSPQGRQAFAKFIVTAHACLEAAIADFGNLPDPGVSSGEIRPWRLWES